MSGRGTKGDGHGANAARFVHTGRCCYGELAGPDAERAYGFEPVQVVVCGRWSWPTISFWLVPAAAAEASEAALDQA